jgi:hypothetical protein
MAGRSGSVIELSGDERVELERRVACYTLPHKVVVRAKMILYAAEGQPTAEIARRLETAPTAILRGAPGWVRGSRARRPPAPFSPRNRSPR